MTVVNAIGVIVLIAVVVIGSLIKLYTRSKLAEIDGLGCFHHRESDENNNIYM